MTILLGATFALLLAAVALSIKGMNDGVKNAPQEEIKRLKKQIELIRSEQRKMATEQDYRKVPANTATVEPEPSEVEEIKNQLAEKEAELARIAEEKADAEKKADTFRDEAGLIGQRELEKSDNELRRARLIRDALLIGRIKEYVSNPEIGGFVTIDIVMPENVQVGSILAIRRNTGVLGQVKVNEVTAEGAIASPMPGFGTIVPQTGDELIIPPQI
jgi:hypothetical protein